MKKFIIFLMVFTLCLTSFTACSKKDSNTGNSNNTSTAVPDSSASGPLFKQPVTLKLMTISHPTWPYNSEWWIYKALEKATNVHLDVIPVPQSNYVEKLHLTMASGDIPDLVFINDNDVRNKYGAAGAFANITKNLNEKTMPNLYKLYNESKENQAWVKRFTSGDGMLYSLPNFEYGDGNRMTWMFREDAFKANNLSIPKTYDELYKDLKVLKEKNPDSYPFSFRDLYKDGNNNRLNLMASQWGTGYPYDFDAKTQTWKFGPEAASFKDLAMWLNKLYKEKLIPTDFLTFSAQQWEEMMSSGKGMVSVDYTMRIEQFDKAMKPQNPNFELKFMAPPTGTTNGQQKLTFTAIGNATLVISAASKKIDAAVKYCDWLYTKEAKDMVSWGKEGETYKVVDGKRTWIKPAGSEKDGVEKIYGLGTMGTYLWYDGKTFQVDATPEYIESISETKKYDAPLTPLAAYNEVEAKMNNTVGQTIITKLNEQITRFIVGQRDFSEWDSMVKEMKDLGVDKMLKAMNDSYVRSK